MLICTPHYTTVCDVMKSELQKPQTRQKNWWCNTCMKACSWLSHVSYLTAAFWSRRSKWSDAGLKPALRAKRITAQHHPVSAARRKSFLTLRRTVSALCALRPDWSYCTSAYCTLRYWQPSTVKSCTRAATLAGAVNSYCYSVHSSLMQFGGALNFALRTKRSKNEHRPMSAAHL